MGVDMIHRYRRDNNACGAGGIGETVIHAKAVMKSDKGRCNTVDDS